MELVYLWVEEYKNIHKQGFNFSPRFRCEYDEETEKLEIIDKEETGEFYPKNFFGDNINITAIVGENGSGKSSLVFDFIMNRKGFFIIKKDDELIVNLKNINVKTNIRSYKYKSNFYDNVLFYSMDKFELAKSRSHLNVIDLQETNKLITENYLKLQEYSFELFDFKPYFIKYDFLDLWIDSDYEFQENDIEDVKSALGMSIKDDSYQIYDVLRVLRDLEDDYLIYLFNKFETIAQIFEHINLIDKVHPKDFYLMVDYEEIQEILKNCDIDFIDKKTFDLLKENEGKFLEIKTLGNLFGKEYLELFFNKMVDELEFDFMAENSSSYGSLSHGEKTIYSFYVNLINYNRKEFIFVLDEPDNTLHPNWQKNFINKMIEIIERLEKKVHFIITSHSPFLLSDLPKENVIFLEKGKQVYPFEDGKQTFGANIHTLLYHGFFMKDGLMGEFAKNKINEVINFLNGNESSIMTNDEAQNLINIIGEPVIKKQLQKMLDSKRLSKIDEIDLIKNQMKELSKRLEEIENAKD
ncbi:AAA family ATPase [Aliarcobacter butzleri]|uniref:AAA family ATPase n=1 Tax=Aliarcobacter butzleri TaxID=28197 RepID=UPI0012F9A832|nr:AAA family ATPase [Aliarcobacter butzleri]